MLLLIMSCSFTFRGSWCRQQLRSLGDDACWVGFLKPERVPCRLKYFEEVYTSEHWMMRVYRVLPPAPREVCEHTC